jgi:ubiquinone/menaquinone biosynthesis C-methylase UbiE
MTMHRLATLAVTTLIVVTPAYAQQPSARQVAQERAQAEADVPKLVDVLGLKPGMSVADVGAGFGAVTVVLGKWIGDGHIFATDIGERQLRVIREYVESEGLRNVTVIEGAAAATNLPAGCCDAIFMRDVYHHITAVEPFNKSLLASLKPGGRLAIIDFLPDVGSKLPAGVPANRGGHGVSPAIVVEEMTAAGFTHVRTIDNWPPGDKPPFFHLSLFTKNVPQPDAAQIAQERAEAEYDAPHLVGVLGLKPGMAVADIGTGGGAMSVVLGKWIGSGRVYATDITESALQTTREYAKKEGLTNVTVIEGGADRTNLPPQCCDALFLRHVYHHITAIDAFNISLLASLKPGGRLAIIDFVPRKGSPLPEGVPANRGGHGIPPSVVIEEMKTAGFTYVRTVEDWPPGKKGAALFLTLFTKR